MFGFESVEVKFNAAVGVFTFFESSVSRKVQGKLMREHCPFRLPAGHLMN